jgi:hypothetical protein
MFVLIAALAGIVAQAVPAPTPTAQAPELNPVTVTGKRAAQDPLICKVSAPMGSKIPSKTCIRKSEAEQVTRDARRFAEDIQTKQDPFFRPKEP